VLWCLFGIIGAAQLARSLLLCIINLVFNFVLDRTSKRIYACYELKEEPGRLLKEGKISNTAV
jgi:hypothetical protein